MPKSLSASARFSDRPEKIRVLLLEDDETSAYLISRILEKESVQTQWIRNSDSCFMAMDVFSPHILIADIMLKDSPLNGIEVCRRIKAIYPRVQVMLISGITDPFDIVSGLESGAEDYLTKPVDIDLLRARIRVMLRRFNTSQSTASPNQYELCSGLLSMNFNSRKVFWGEQEMLLRRKEFDLLAYLLKHNGRVISREELLEFIWGGSDVSDRTIDTHIQRLRQKLEQFSEAKDLIETLRGVGYRYKGNSSTRPAQA
jgi:two-component system alkaline phosphatase synthesis response regulator PhoP